MKRSLSLLLALFSGAALFAAESFQISGVRQLRAETKLISKSGPIVDLIGKSGKQNGKSYYVAGSLLLPEPIDLRGKEFHFTADALRGATSVVGLFIRMFNAGERKPAWSHCTWNFPFRKFAQSQFTTFREGGSNVEWETHVLSGSEAAKINRIEFHIATQMDNKDLQIRFSNFRVQELTPLSQEEIRSRKATEKWTNVPVYSDKAVPLRPAGSIRPEDIQRAKENIRRHKWAKNYYDSQMKKHIDFWMNLDEEGIKLMVPAEDAWFKCLCPNCGTQPEFAWKGDAVLMPDMKSIRCTKCKMVFPNEKYPENYTYTIKERDGREKTFRCYRGKNQIGAGENFGPNYHISGAVNYVKIRKIGTIFYPAFQYALSGDIKYAKRVRDVLLRFAEVYPNYTVKYRATPYATPRTSRFGMGGKLCAWKVHDSGNMYQVFNAYAMTRSSGVYTEADRLAIENRLCREYKWLITAFPPADACSNAIPQHMTAGALCASLLGDHELMDWVLLGENGFISFIAKWYSRDGHWHENTASYANMANEPMIRLVAALNGYSDPPEYTGDDRYDNLDILALIPELRQVFSGMAPANLPTGSLPAFNDSAFNAPQRMTQLEFLSALDPSEENRQLMAYFVTGTPRQPNEVSLLYRDPEIKWNGVLPECMATSCLMPGPGWVVLRRPETARQSAVSMMYSGYINSHSHSSTLGYLYCDYGKELSSELGYLSYWHPLLKWLQSALAHNIVLVDGQSQSSARQGYPELFADGAISAIRVAAPSCYPDVTERYERMLLNIPLSGKRQYLADYFYVKGGQKHLFAFHADGKNFAPPAGIQFAPAELPDNLDAASGKKFIQSTEGADLPAGMHAARWDFDKSIQTTLHFAAAKPMKLYHSTAAGLRDMNSPYTDVPLHLFFAESDGPENAFASVLSATKDAVPTVNEVKSLDLAPGSRPATALQIDHVDGTDLVIFSNDTAGEILLQDYPDFRQSARTAIVRLRGGKAKTLWCENGSVALGEAALTAPATLTGIIQSVDAAKKTVTVQWDDSAAAQIRPGDRLYLPKAADGVYLIRSAESNGKISVITMDPSEKLRLKAGDPVQFPSWRTVDLP